MRIFRWWRRWFGPQEVAFPAGVIRLAGPLSVHGRVRLVGVAPAALATGATVLGFFVVNA